MGSDGSRNVSETMWSRALDPEPTPEARKAALAAARVRSADDTFDCLPRRVRLGVRRCISWQVAARSDGAADAPASCRDCPLGVAVAGRVGVAFGAPETAS